MKRFSAVPGRFGGGDVFLDAYDPANGALPAMSDIDGEPSVPEGRRSIEPG